MSQIIVRSDSSPELQRILGDHVKAKIEITECQEYAHTFRIADFKSSITPDLLEQDHSLRQFFEILMNQKGLRRLFLQIFTVRITLSAPSMLKVCSEGFFSYGVCLQAETQSLTLGSLKLLTFSHLRSKGLFLAGHFQLVRAEHHSEFWMFL